MVAHRSGFRVVSTLLAKLFRLRSPKMLSNQNTAISSTTAPATEKRKALFLPNLENRTVVLLACGPSLNHTDIEAVRDAQSRGTVYTVAINEAGLSGYLPKSLPNADLLYAADAHWWRHYRPQTRALKVGGEPVPEIKRNGRVIDPGYDLIAVRMLSRGEPMPTIYDGAVLSGDHSGFQALGLVLALGAARCILLGFDCGGKQRNAHMDRPTKFMPGVDWPSRAGIYGRVPIDFPDREVFNCSRDSSITAFATPSLSEVLP